MNDMLIGRLSAVEIRGRTTLRGMLRAWDLWAFGRWN